MKTQPYHPKLTEVSLHISQLQYQCFHWTVPHSQRVGGLIEFVGKYRVGSAGTDDALFMSWRIKEFCEYGGNDSRPSGIIVDLRRLDYEWGDDLIEIWPASLGERPLLVLVAPERYETFAGVLEHGLRTDLDQAFAEMSNAIRVLKY